MSTKRNVMVTSGGGTTESLTGISAKDLRADVQKRADAKKNSVVFVGRAGTLPIRSPEYTYAQNGKVIGKDTGLVMKFNHERCVYDLTDPSQVKEVEEIREWLEAGRDPRIRRLGVSELQRQLPEPPVRRWHDLTAKKLLGMIGDMLEPGDVNGNSMFIAQCIEYELLLDSPRKSLLKGLEELMDDPTSEDVIEAEVTL